MIPEGQVLLAVPKFAADTKDGRVMSRTLTLPSHASGAMVTFTDAGQDGYCCNWGPGGYVVTSNGQVIATGGQFGAEVNVTVPAGVRWMIPALDPGTTVQVSTTVPIVMTSVQKPSWPPLPKVRVQSWQ